MDDSRLHLTRKNSTNHFFIRVGKRAVEKKVPKRLDLLMNLTYEHTNRILTRILFQIGKTIRETQAGFRTKIPSKNYFKRHESDEDFCRI